MVNALGLESLDIGGVGGDVGAGAGGSEGTGDGDEDDLLALELCEGIVSIMCQRLCVWRGVGRRTNPCWRCT